MFSEVVQFQQLLETVSGTHEPKFTSEWPTTTISNQKRVSGNKGAKWNYGDNFGGGDDYSTDHTIFGNFGVKDTAYSGSDGIKLCPGTHNAECSG
mmetsp:Transcript_8158/g.27385  ORF Transcript_8158/g.27385 Transcript_8158/m.27385 type:complete len:95 (-) Transcript_8158:1114-1398(-)